MKNILQLLIVLLTLGSCHRGEITPPKIDVLPEGMVRVPITLTLPNPSQITTRAAVDLLPNLEKRIERVCIAVFAAPTATANTSDILLQLADGAQTIIDDNNAYVLLDEYTGDYRLMAIVNYSDNFDAQLTTLKSDLANGTATYGQFISLTEDLTALYAGGDLTAGQIEIGATQNLTGPLPMYSDLTAGTDIVPSTQITLNLSNNYSRITVDASTVATANYTILGATLLQGAVNITYDPAAALSTSTIGSGAISYKETEAQHKIPNTLVNHVSPIYLFPNNGDGGANPTNIIIRGDYTDAKGNTYSGFHKISIKHNSAPNTITYDIVNNNLYRVLITKVNSSGYSTFTGAELAEPNSDIIYDIVVDDDTSLDIVTGNGAYYIGVSNSDYIVYDDDALTDLAATTFNYNLSPGAITDGVILPTPTITATGGGLSLTNPSASYTAGVSNDVEINLAASFTSGDITLRLGNIAHRINIVRGATQSSASSTLNDFATNEYVYGLFDGLPTSNWLTFTNAPSSSEVSSDLGGVPLDLSANTSGVKRTYIPIYISSKDGKGRTKVIISQN